jgi:spore coat polysaccharide biosynthesis protein SpsF
MSSCRRVIATIEARTKSTRLPAKVLALIEGKPLLEHLIERVRAAASIEQIVVATTTSPQDDTIVALAERLGVLCFRGSEEDVMGRVLGAARQFGADDLVALTGDNPLIDPQLVDDVVALYRTGGFDYVTTTHMHHSPQWGAERTFPVGVSIQVFSTDVLADVALRTTAPAEREHSSFAIYNDPSRYRLGALHASGKYADWRHPELRLTVDTQEDLTLIREVFRVLYPQNPLFSTGSAIQLVVGDPRLRGINQHIVQRLAYQKAVKPHG